jgi:aspartyl-tRNA synthetase
MKTKRTTIATAATQIGETVLLKGWVQTERDMGKIAFIDLRDETGLLQIVIPGDLETPRVGVEYVVEIEGVIRARGERFMNPKLATGSVELGATSVKIINSSADLPFEIKHDTIGINEELRLKHRYLDLRSERMTHNIRMRHKVSKFFRDYLDADGFIEVETPILTKGTPEGAREFLVPSRLHPEEFYVLPQSPQQFKQLLMVGGIGKYFQIARCLRDEDQRGDRQPEFTQLDIEMSFVDQEDILALNEAMLIKLIETVAPDKKISQLPFPRITYAESMKKYGNDKPDLRKDKEDPNELAFVWVTDFPMFEKDGDGGKLGAVHHPFTAPNPDDLHLLETKPFEARSIAYDIALNGFEIGGGSIRISDAELQTKIFSLLGVSDDDIQARFGHMLEAFSFGVPPHGGIAYGLERLLMILCNEPNIREVMAFPKTGDARDPLMGAPSAVSDDSLEQAHIKVVPPFKAKKKA